ncbi:NAC domain-containing protein [Forsythia ovata]|uniref:NAC domain-containing protein n=1 Tax=Forsythia ovata TaxID=205694 RepID=A0ABD1TBS8_9LAMI
MDVKVYESNLKKTRHEDGENLQLDVEVYESNLKKTRHEDEANLQLVAKVYKSNLKKTREEDEENLQLVVEIYESNLKKTRHEDEENLQLVAEVYEFNLEKTREDAEVYEFNLEKTREEDEENLQLVAEVDDDDEPSTMNKEFILPHSYRFNPTAIELLEHYLINKILRQLVWNSIREIDFYQCDPEQLPIREFNAIKYGREGEAYFFTREEQKYLDGSRLSRSPFSNGYWKRCGREVPIHNGNEIIGFKRRFVWEEELCFN